MLTATITASAGTAFETESTPNRIRPDRGLIRVWVVNLTVIPLPKVVDYIDDFAVPGVWNAFLECNAKYRDNVGVTPRTLPHALLHQQLDALLRNTFGHVVIDAPAGQNYFRMITITLGLERKIKGVDSDAMPPHQARLEVQEIPFGSRGTKNILGIYPKPIEYSGELIDKSDVDVPLAILDDLRRLGNFDRGGLGGRRPSPGAVASETTSRVFSLFADTTFTMFSKRWLLSPGLICSGE